MNIVTRALAIKIKDRRLKDWIAHWDALEALVIRVYKGNQAGAQDEAEWGRLRPWLQKEYPRWETALGPHWRQAHVAGEPAREDPFLRLLAYEQAQAFVGNWAAMKTLPAAREALNRLLMEMGEGKDRETV
jgi:hypothetical protein